MATESATVLNRVAAELFGRSARLKEYVLGISFAESRSYEQLVLTIVSSLERIESEVKATLSNIGDRYAKAESKMDHEDLQEAFFALGRLARWFLDIHWQFVKYLPGGPVLPEAIFALRDSFGSLFPQQKPSVLLGTEFDVVEFDFFKNLIGTLADPEEMKRIKGPRNVVILLPICEHKSPAAWAVLAHELGHAIDEIRDFTANVCAELCLPHPDAENVPDDKKEFLRAAKWCREICADLIAARVLGPAFILSLTSLDFCFCPLMPLYDHPKIYKAHPPTRKRLEVTSEYLKQEYLRETTDQAGYVDFSVEERKLLESAYRLQLSLHLFDERHPEGDHQSLAEASIPSMVERLLPKIGNLGIPLPRLEEPSVIRCINRLRKGQPVGAQGAARESLRRAVRGFREKTAQKTLSRSNLRDDFYALLARFREGALDIPAILLSSHLARHKVISQFSAEVHTTINSSQIEALCKELSILDDRGVASIRSCGVHKELLKHRKENGALNLDPSRMFREARVRISSLRRELGILSDIQILERIVAPDGKCVFVSPLIDPLEQLGPSSLDLRLGTDLQVTKNTQLTDIDLRTSKRKSELEQQIKKSTTTWLIQPEEYFVLHPGEFALASTLEFICLPDDIAGRLEGRSTWGRLGLQIHATAGFVDPGFRGSLTFELINSGKLPIKLSPGLRLGQICFFRVHEVQVNYKMKKRSKYADQTGVVPCKAPEEPEVGS